MSVVGPAAAALGMEEGKLASSPPVTPLERQRLLAGAVTQQASSSAAAPAAQAESSGVATPDRVNEAAAPSCDGVGSKKLSGRSDVAVQVEEERLEPTAADAARCLRVALLFTQQQAPHAPKPSAQLALAIKTLATFVETAEAAERARAPPAKRARAVVRRSNPKPAGDASDRPDPAPKPKAPKEEKGTLTAAEKRLLELEQQIPDTFVVSDAISAKTVAASDLFTPRFKATAANAAVDSFEADRSHLEDTSDAVFEAMHRPRERDERAAHKDLFQPTRPQPSRSPRAGPAASPRASPRAFGATGEGAPAAVAPLSLDGPAAQSTSAEPDDWEVLGRRSGTNQIVLRKMRKRRHEGAGERERKLLRAAVFANVSSN